MKAVHVVVFDAADPSKAVECAEVPVPEPGAGEVLVRVTLRPVNPADGFSLMGELMACGHMWAATARSERRRTLDLLTTRPRAATGVYPGFAPASLPAVPGLDGTGVVEKCGAGASKFAAGARVVAAPWPTKSGSGTWQQYVVVPEAALVAVAEGVSDEDAAQFLVRRRAGRRRGFAAFLGVPSTAGCTVWYSLSHSLSLARMMHPEPAGS